MAMKQSKQPKPPVSLEGGASLGNKIESSDILELFNSQQKLKAQELELQKEEIKTREQIFRIESDNDLASTKHTNDAIAKDRQRDRVLVIAIVIITFLFVLAMLYMNKDILVMDLVKVGLGFLAGLGLARIRQPSE